MSINYLYLKAQAKKASKKRLSELGKRSAIKASKK